MRSNSLNSTYWIDFCQAVFSEDIHPPAANATNAHYGGLDIEGKNIFFLTASEDPWQYAGKTSLSEGDEEMKAWHIECENCAHCIDLHTPSDDDDSNLGNARSNVYQAIVNWLDEDAQDKDGLKNYYQLLETSNKLDFIQ